MSTRPSYVSFHTVDEAPNTVDSVEVYKWNTKEQRPQEVVTSRCAAHQTHTAAIKGDGTSDHKVNLNPKSGLMLDKLHENIRTLGRRQKGT